jgi:Mn-dependent DtxR family transcriptional regulator
VIEMFSADIVLGRGLVVDFLERVTCDVLTDGRDAGEPWGYANPKRLEEKLEIRRQYINRALQGLVDAGWVEKANRGLYRYVADPREE